MSYSRAFAGRVPRPPSAAGAHAVWRMAGPIFAIAVIARPVFVWDSATPTLITHLAGAVWPNPLKAWFEHHVTLLEKCSIGSDTVLRLTFGAAASRRRYIDLEYFGGDPFGNLNRYFSSMDRRWETGKLAHSVLASISICQDRAVGRPSACSQSVQAPA